MNADEIIPSEVQSQHRVVVFPFLAVGVREARQPSNLHPERKVQPFAVARASAVKIGVAAAVSSFGADYRGRRVAPSGFAVDPTEALDNLGVVDAKLEDQGDGRLIRPVSAERFRAAAGDLYGGLPCTQPDSARLHAL